MTDVDARAVLADAMGLARPLPAVPWAQQFGMHSLAHLMRDPSLANTTATFADPGVLRLLALVVGINTLVCCAVFLYKARTRFTGPPLQPIPIDFAIQKRRAKE